MIEVRLSKDRGHANHEWLDSYHTFSFANYYDQRFMGFRQLRVINEDFVDAGQGFDTHPHKDMEIFTYVLEGALEHKDSMGTGSVIVPGDVQIMSAGTGVAHSEFNHSQKDKVHLLQIWIVPEKKGLKPRYNQKTFYEKDKKGKLCLIISPDESQGSLKIFQDVKVFASMLSKADQVSYPLNHKRFGWVQVITGELTLNNQKLKSGDGAAVSQEKLLEFSAAKPTEFLFFDLP